MKFLIETSFKGIPTPDALALLPVETARGMELDAQGVRQWLLIAADQSKAWQLIKADSLEAARDIATSFPLHPYMNTMITPVA